MALTLQRDLLEGDTVRVSSIKMPAPRQPDDAPRWLSTEKITSIGDIAQSGSFETDGTAPIAIYMRLPPDLYFGAQRNLGLHLGYRYNGIPISSDSSLQVSLNDSYVSSTPLPHTDKASADLETIVPVPVSDIRPFSNSMLMRFIFLQPKKAECQDAVPNNLKGAVFKDSYLDIRESPTGRPCRISRSSPTPDIPSPDGPTSPTPQSCCPTLPARRRSRCTSP